MARHRYALGAKSTENTAEWPGAPPSSDGREDESPTWRRQTLCSGMHFPDYAANDESDKLKSVRGLVADVHIKHVMALEALAREISATEAVIVEGIKLEQQMAGSADETVIDLSTYQKQGKDPED